MTASYASASSAPFSRPPQRRAMRQRPLEQFGADKPVAQPLLKVFFILERHEKPWTHESHFGALSCVAPSFLASSTPCLQFACIGPRISAHLEKAFTASSKCDAFSFA